MVVGGFTSLDTEKSLEIISLDPESDPVPDCLKSSSSALLSRKVAKVAGTAQTAGRFGLGYGEKNLTSFLSAIFIICFEFQVHFL